MPQPRKPDRAYRFAAKKPTIDEILASDADLKRTSAEFLKVDVETALTFADIALKSHDNQVKKDRNRMNARRAYDMISRFVQKIPLTEADAFFLASALQRLKSRLEILGEDL